MPIKPKKKRELLTLDDIDQRTQAAAQAAGMRDRIVADKGGRDRLSDLEYDQIENASLTSLILRSLQLRWVKREQITADERALVGTISTVQNTYNRLVEMVGTTREPRDVTTLADVLARHAAKTEGARDA